MWRLAACLLLLLSPAARADILTEPRIPAKFEWKSFSYDKAEHVTTLYHEPGSSSVLVGAEDVLYQFDFNSFSKRTTNFNVTDPSPYTNKLSCKNYLTVVQKFKRNILVCGTSAGDPKCWNWMNGNKSYMMDGRGFSPFVLDKNFLILFSGNEVYSTIGKKENNGKIPRFRSIYGMGPSLYTADNLMANPQYVKVKLVTHEESYKSKIYFFFQEKNPEKNVESDNTVSRVAQLCKEDAGGEGGQLSSKWSTFLKARLECGYPVDGMFYSRLQDIFFVDHEKREEIRIYGVFSNPWNDTAVCVYTMADIESVFRTSRLKGDPKTDHLTIRPGECLSGGRKTPMDTANTANDYPEMEQAVAPDGKQPLFRSNYTYRKIVVDQVTAADNTSYTVLVLATGLGVIHKFIIFSQSDIVNVLEIRPFKDPTSIQSMELDMKLLYLSSSQNLVALQLDWCFAYGNTCQSCVMARDPYCGWINGTCASVFGHQGSIVQNVRHGISNKCPPETAKNMMLEDTSDQWSTFLVEPGTPVFLSCPLVSRHAKYSFSQNGSIHHDCKLDLDSHRCIHFINHVTDDDYGTYSCMSEESGSTKIVANYTLERNHGSVAINTLEINYGRLPMPKHEGNPGSVAMVSLWLVVTQIVVCLLLLQ